MRERRVFRLPVLQMLKRSFLLRHEFNSVSKKNGVVDILRCDSPRNLLCQAVQGSRRFLETRG